MMGEAACRTVPTVYGHRAIFVQMKHPLRWIAFGLYVLSMFWTVFQGSDLKGYYLLLFGVIGLLDADWVVGLPWLANLGFLLAYRWHASPRRTVLVGVSLLLASLVWQIHHLPGMDPKETVVPDWGLRFWYAAFVLLAVDAFLGRAAAIRKRPPEDATRPAENSDVREPMTEKAGS